MLRLPLKAFPRLEIAQVLVAVALSSAICAVGALPLPTRSAAAIPTLPRLSGGRGRVPHRIAHIDRSCSTRSGSWSWIHTSSGSFTRTHKVLLAVLFYFSTSLSLTFMNKSIFQRFHFPLFVTNFQLIVTWILLWMIGTAGQWDKTFSFAPPPEFDISIAVQVVPVTFLYVGMLSMTNYCLRFVDVSFYQILRSLVIPLNILSSFVILGYLPRLRTLGCCLVVMLGFFLGSVSELNFTYEGFFTGCLASLFMALYSTYVKKVLTLVNGSTWRLMHYTTILATVMTAPLVLVSGEYSSALKNEHFYQRSFWAIMTASALFGFLINLAYFALIKHGSPLTTHISSCAKSALQAALGIAFYKNKVTSVNVLGIFLTLLGSAMYSWDRYVQLDTKET